MSNYMMISTWKMSELGMEKAIAKMQQQKPLSDCIITLLQSIEDEEKFCSVGYGGLPNKDGVVELDGAYMNGDDLSFGAVMGLVGFKSPIEIAYHLSKNSTNCVLCGDGATKYGDEQGFERRNNLTKKALERYNEKKNEAYKLKAYDGHDTCCVVATNNNSVHTGVTTSGLFMKHAGRVGDSPIIGSGFYSKSGVGGACATGLGEDIMRGCLSYAVVELMDNGVSPQEACRIVLDKHLKMLAKRIDVGGISLIAINTKKEFGAATNEECFPFVVGSEEGKQLYYVKRRHPNYFKADEAWLSSYTGD